jgi:hypothetical protein
MSILIQVQISCKRVEVMGYGIVVALTLLVVTLRGQTGGITVGTASSIRSNRWE